MGGGGFTKDAEMLGSSPVLQSKQTSKNNQPVDNICCVRTFFGLQVKQWTVKGKEIKQGNVPSYWQASYHGIIFKDDHGIVPFLD